MPDNTCCEYTSIGRDGSDRKYSSAENASANAIGRPATMLNKNPVANNINGVIACAGMAAFQPHTTAASTAAVASVPHTALRGPSSAAAKPNSSMSALPITIGPI